MAMNALIARYSMSWQLTKYESNLTAKTQVMRLVDLHQLNLE